MKKYLSIFLICFLLFGASVPAFASTSTIVPPNLDPTQYDSYIISYDNTKGGRYYCTLFLASDFDVFYNSSGLIGLMPKTDTAHIAYDKFVNVSDYNPNDTNNGWGTFSKSSYFSYETKPDGSEARYIYHANNFGSSDYVIASTVDIPNATYYGSKDGTEVHGLVYEGGFFFQLIPPLVLATEEALTLFQNQTFQTIAIIVLCGVGCLALLIGLNLLRKVIPQFLNK